MLEKENQTDSCEPFELLISCRLDGEIDAEEQVQLDLHLDECESCRLMVERFADVDGLVSSASAVAGANMGVMPKSKTDGNFGQNGATQTAGVRSMKRTRNFLFVVSAVAAVLVVAVMMQWSWAGSQNDNHFDIGGPVVSLSEIYSQRIHDQEMLRESLEYDLRALKLQLIARYDSSLDDESQEWLERIDELMEKIDQAKVIN